MFDRTAFKLEAKSAMHARSPQIYLVTLVLMVATYVLNALSTRLELSGVPESLRMEIRRGIINEYTLERLSQSRPGVIASLLTIAIGIMLLMLTVGYSSYIMRAGRDQESGMSNLLDGFTLFLRVIWLSILMSVFIFLWSLLLVIPGIVAAYRYSMAVFILLDHPEMSAMDCIRQSKAMTRGHKGQLFVLDLSFLGWYILCVIPFVSVYVTPYTSMTHFKAYEYLSIPVYEPRL